MGTVLTVSLASKKLMRIYLTYDKLPHTSKVIPKLARTVYVWKKERT